MYLFLIELSSQITNMTTIEQFVFLCVFIAGNLFSIDLFHIFLFSIERTCSICFSVSMCLYL